MPRKGKGGKGLPVEAPQNQAYGQAGDQIAAQNQIPLPDNQSPAQPPGATPLPNAPGQGGIENLLAAASGEGARAFPTPLGAPSTRPNESVGDTLGGSLIPTRPEVVTQTLAEIALTTRDPAVRGMLARLDMTRAANNAKPSQQSFMPPERLELPPNLRR